MKSPSFQDMVHMLGSLMWRESNGGHNRLEELDYAILANMGIWAMANAGRVLWQAYRREVLLEQE